MNTQQQQTIGQIVANDYRTAAVFKKYEIDFCCNGNRLLQDVCKQQSLKYADILDELQRKIAASTKSVFDYANWDIDFLADYVVQQHHKYVEAKIKEIQPYLTKICEVHGKMHPELFDIKSLFEESAEDLGKHLKKEELILFPFIKTLVAHKREKLPAKIPDFETVENPIAMMHQDHDDEGERFRQIAKLSNNYTPPVDACNTYKVAFGLLQEFEADLHLHIHLENNILFPKAIQLEKEIYN
jgi:regulator of cell morphogenesis and NO signaling